MKVLVTGATGFLGRFLAETLKSRGNEVFAIGSKDCDLTLSSSLDQYNSISFDQIYHLAAWIQAGDFHLYHSGEIWTTNQLINTHVLNWWHKRQPQAKMIAMGTSCAYEPGTELKEENYLVGNPHPSLYPYAMTKRMLYIGLEALNKQFGLDYLYFIPSTLYGPGYHNDQRQLHFIFDLIRKIVRAKYKGIPAVLWGDGHQERELVFTQDFVDAMLQLVHHENNQIINLGAGKGYSIRYFANLICQTLDYDPSLIQYDTSKFVGAKSKCLDVTKFENLLPHFKRTSLEEGLEQTIRWFLEAHKELTQV